MLLRDTLRDSGTGRVSTFRNSRMVVVSLRMVVEQRLNDSIDCHLRKVYQEEDYGKNLRLKLCTYHILSFPILL